MYTAKITSITKEHNQADNVPFLAVAFVMEEIVKNEDGTEGKRTVHRNEGFELDTPMEIITERIAKHLSLMKSEAEWLEANKESEALHAKADETIEGLKDHEISIK
jgi:hypothetical protein